MAEHERPGLPKLSERLRDVFGIEPAGPALWDAGTWWTWGQIEQTAQAIDAVLEPGGPGARVAVMMRTTGAVVSCQLALLSRGHTLFTLSPMASGQRMTEDVAASGAEVVLADPADWEEPAFLRGCQMLGARGYSLWPRAGEPLCLVLPGRADRAAAAECSPTVANVMLTSGTTGVPKRIAIGYEALANMMTAVRHYSRATEAAQDGLRLREHPAVVASPLVHSSGFGGVLRAISEARPVVLMERFRPDGWALLVQRFAPRVTALAPAALQMLLDADVDPALLSSLRAIVVGSAALPPALQARFEERYGIPLLSTYGATEFPGGLAGWTRRDHEEFHDTKRGSVGRAHPGVELRIVPDSPDGTAADGRGLLAVRTPVTDRGVDDGWVMTNDVASLDDDGFLYIHGRADDAIVRGGFKIIPQELEDVIQSHPAVRAAGVVGKPDARLGEVPVAFVEVSSPVTADELTRFVRARVMAYQVPVELHVVEALPRTPSMKISKPELRDLLRHHESDQAKGER